MAQQWRDDVLELKHKAYSQAHAMGLSIKVIPSSLLSEIRRVRQHKGVLDQPDRYLVAADFDNFRESLANVSHAQGNRIRQSKFAYTNYLAKVGKERLCSGVLTEDHYLSVLHSPDVDTSLSLMIAFTARVHEGATVWRPCAMLAYKQSDQFPIYVGYEYDGENAPLANTTLPGQLDKGPAACRDTAMNANLRLVSQNATGAITKAIAEKRCAELELLCGARSNANGVFWKVQGAGTALLAAGLAEIAAKRAKGKNKYEYVIMHAAHLGTNAPAAKGAAERLGFASAASWWKLTYQSGGAPNLPANAKPLLPAGVYKTPRHYYVLKGTNANTSWAKRAADKIASGLCSFGRDKSDRGSLCK